MDELMMENSSGRSRLPHLLLPLIQLLALSLPPFKHRAHIFVPVITALVYATYTNLFSDRIETRISLVISWPIFLATVEKLLFSRPEHQYWRRDRAPAEAASMPFGLAKLRWAAALLVNQRGIGWNYQVKGVPPAKPPQTKWQFLRCQLPEYVKYYVLCDMLHVYTSRHYYSEGANMALLTTRANTWSRSFLNALLLGSKIYFPIQLAYTLGSILFVFLDLTQPKDWPPLFGRVQDVTTVRYFWGSFWHQFMRKMFLGYSQALVRLLGIPRGTQLSSYVQLYTSFAISGFFHALMTHSMPTTVNHTFHDRFLLAFDFFILQAMGIHLEDIIISVYESLTRSNSESGKIKSEDMYQPASAVWKTTVGYLWVVCWFWFSLGWGADAILKSGMGNVNDVQIPFVDSFLVFVQKKIPI